MGEPAQWIDGPEVQSEYRQTDALTHPDAEKALAFWNARPPDGIVIGRDVPSRAMSSLLSRVIVYEPVDQGRDFRVHLAGTTLRKRFGSDIKDKLMSELFSVSNFPIRFEAARAAIDEGRPQFAKIVHTHREVAAFRLELMHIPVLAHDRVTPWVLTFVFYFG